MGGDFNTTINNNVDRSRDIIVKQKPTNNDRDTKQLVRYLTDEALVDAWREKHPEYRDRKQLVRYLTDEALVDVWREKHPKEKDYTYYSSVHATYSCMDFILTKPTLLQYMQSAKIHNLTWSDHG